LHGAPSETLIGYGFDTRNVAPLRPRLRGALLLLSPHNSARAFAALASVAFKCRASLGWRLVVSRQCRRSPLPTGLRVLARSRPMLDILFAQSQCRAARLRRLRSVAHVPPQFAMVVCLPSQASVGKLPGSLGFHAACLAHWARRHSAPGTPDSRPL